MMSYTEYLAATKQSDTRRAWIWWKIEICGMSESEAIKAASDPVWGWKPHENHAPNDLCDVCGSLLLKRGSAQVCPKCEASQH